MDVDPDEDEEEEDVLETLPKHDAQNDDEMDVESKYGFDTYDEEPGELLSMFVDW